MLFPGLPLICPFIGCVYSQRKSPYQSRSLCWKAQGWHRRETFMSNLQKNQELKNILLAETPPLTKLPMKPTKTAYRQCFDLNTMTITGCFCRETGRIAKCRWRMELSIKRYARQPYNHSGNGNACPAGCIDSSGC